MCIVHCTIIGFTKVLNLGFPDLMVLENDYISYIPCTATGGRFVLYNSGS